MKKKDLEPSHLLGEFLWKNRVITAGQLNRAIEYQKKVNRNLGVMQLAENLLREDEMSLVHARLTVTDETFEEALTGLGLLSPEEFAEMKRVKKDFRIPLGLILQNQKAVSPEKFRLWLSRFENQKFNRQQLKAYLKKIPLFQSLNDATLKEVAGMLKYKYCTAGEYLYRTHEDSDGVYIVESGLIRLLVDMKSEQRIIGSRHNGDTFGLPGALNHTPREESALAITDTVLWRLGSEDFYRLFEKNPRMAADTGRQLGDTYQSALARFKLRGLVSDSKITVVIVDSDRESRRRVGQALMESLEASLPERALIVSTLPGARPPGVKKIAAASFQEAKPVRTARGRAEFLYLSRFENARQFDSLSAWLRRRTRRHSAIVFVVSPGNRDFRRFIMGLCRRSVTLIRENIPDWVRYLRPGRDRLYQLQTDSREGDLARHRVVADDCPGVALPYIIDDDGLDRSAAEIARWLAGISVGVAFGGGGARGLAHMGVLEILEMVGLPIDMVTGTSAGAHVAGMVALGWKARAMIDYIRVHAIEKRGHPFNDWTLPRRSVVRGKKYRALLDRAFGDAHMADTLLPFFPVCTDLRTGKQVVVDDLPVRDAVLASGAVPGVFPPFRAGERALGDGGMVNNLPASLLKSWEIDFVICINISIDPARSRFNPDSFGAIVQQALDIFMDQSIRNHLDYTDFEIKPEVHEFAVTDHRKGEEIIERGREAARKILPQLVRIARKNGIVLRPDRKAEADA